MSKKDRKRQKKRVPRSKGRGCSLKSQQAEERKRSELEGAPDLDELVRIALRGFAHCAMQGWASVKPFINKNKVIIRAWLIFLLWISIFATLLVTKGRVIDPPLITAVARSTAFILNLLGTEAWVQGFTIHSSDFSVMVIPACTGLLPTLLFLAAVFAYPCKIKEKALGVAIGIPAIFLINLVRMVSLFYIGLYLPRAFEQVHLLVWQPLMVFAAVALWLLWVGRFTRGVAK